jgi:predicted dehydrogenase
MGNQGTAESSLREAAHVIKAGACGKVKEVHVWTNRPVWPQGLSRPSEVEAVPTSLHWDEWLGCAPERPYNKAYHPFKWRGWWDFGTGALGDMACHTLNMPYMALSLKDPISVQAETAGHNKETYPAWSIIKYEFPASMNPERPALTFIWYDGGKRPPQELLKGAEMKASGCLVIGDKDSLYAPGDYAEQGTKLLSGNEKPKVEFKKSPGHFKEWVQAIQGGDPAMSNFPDYAAGLTETVLLGNLAVWASGEKVMWDAKTMTAKASTDVSHIIKKEYRKGYSI